MRAPRFRRRRGGGLEVRLLAAEAQMLRDVASGLREVVAPTVEPGASDPALERLYPPAYRDDDEAAREWSSLTHDDLERERLGAIDAVGASLERGRARGGAWSVDLDAEEAQAWLGVLNDARLVLGVRLRVTEEMRLEDFGAGDPARASFEAYSYLGWVQSELLDALDPGLLDDVEPR